MTDDLAQDPAALAARAPLYLLAFEESAQALDAQERAVNELRMRAGVLMAAAAVATSFFGGQALAGDHFEPAAWVAVIAFTLIGVAVLVVLWPGHAWHSHATAANLITEYAEPEDMPVEMIHRDLALHRAASFVENAGQLRWLLVSFRSGLVLLVIEMASWLVALADGT